MTLNYTTLDQHVERATWSPEELRTVDDLLRELDELPRSTQIFAYDGSQVVALDGELSSYRGYYDDLAVGYDYDVDHAVTAAEISQKIRKTIGTSLPAHKGGDTDPISTNTRVWLSREGHADAITFSHFVLDDSRGVFIVERGDV